MTDELSTLSEETGYTEKELPDGDYRDWDDTVFTDSDKTITLRQLVKEIEDEIHEEILSVAQDNWDYHERITIHTNGGIDYKAMVSENAAEKLAIDIVKQDLEGEQEIFNQDWLRSCMDVKLSGQSFLDYAAQDAVDTDGWIHFLNSYDGDYSTTKSGLVYWRDS